MNKKTTAAIIVILIAAAVLIYRYNSELTIKDAEPAVSGNTESVWSNGKYDPPITITRIMKHNTYSTKFREGEDWDHNIFSRWLEGSLGMKVRTLWVVSEENDAFSKKLMLSITRGEELPDIVAFRGSYDTLVQLIDSGHFMPVDELFDEYAGDIWKEVAAQYPSMWISVTRNGNRYALPLLEYSMNTEPVLWIRQDWMEKFNLKAPETMEDLEAIMEVFTNEDPDGNGIDDTYGMAVTLRASLNTWMTDLSWVFGAYGAVNSQWNLNAEGELAYGSIQPGAKQALAQLNRWMEKGYIARESSTWDEVKASELFTSGKAGIIAGPHWMPDWPLFKLQDSVPEAKYKAYAVPAGPDGVRGVRAGGPAPVNGVVLINKDSKHPEAFLRYYNYLLEHYANPSEGSSFEYGFAEGYDYLLDDGELVKNNPDFVSPMDYSLSYEGARIPDLMINTLVKLSSKPPETPFERQVYWKRSLEEIEAASIVMDYERQGVRHVNWFEGSESGTAKSRSELLFQMEREAFTKMIYGQLPVEAFDEFVAQWRSGGGDQMTAEVNEVFKQFHEGR
ncbi:extracellular solute-binding protein [Paenibacillus sp. JCM 10914]|uniref:extracellular solute-binding protein n=1 Tax=Paenibacillus sp. JCM 10914 TaxID=1236974 RepID=UPI0003CC7DD8|nr:extracellular solute-binding protein [Paenibacillus sp. JCM 10914]GAE07094.1 sugar ABC transporter substrate-binding protein [Paenibacillus sp. JCM 10914]